MRIVELHIDVTGSVPLDGPLHIAATAYLPEPETLGRNPCAVIALPGGGYSREYFHLRLAGRSGYSQAEHHVARGLIFIALDHLGVGGSSVSHLDLMSTEMISAANNRAVTTVLGRLQRGELDADFPPVPQVVKLGIGQSMGGSVTVLMQAQHQTYDAIAVLGFSAVQFVIPQRTTELTRQAKSEYAMDKQAAMSGLSPQRVSAIVPDMRYCHFWDDVEEDIVEADFGGGYPVRRTTPYWGSTTLPACALTMLAPGFLAREAGVIEVPVFLGFGERDGSENPRAEPSAYAKSRDILLCIVPRMAHMHNFATTRSRLWDRLADWAAMMAGESRSD